MSETTEAPALESRPLTPDTVTASPFALSDDHEFPELDRKKFVADKLMEANIALSEQIAADLAEDLRNFVPPAQPGSPNSPFRRCHCLGALPGRVCSFCSGTRWTRICPKCDGEGRVEMTVRRGAERSMPCGNCMTRGTLPASLTELRAAEAAYNEYAAQLAAGPGDPSAANSALPDPDSPRRAVRLPGIGATEHKKFATQSAKKKARKRNEARKVRRAAEQLVNQGVE